MSTVVKFDTITFSVLQIREVENVSDIEGRPGFLINPEGGIPPGPWDRLIVSGNTVILRTQSDLDAKDASEATGLAAEAVRRAKNIQAQAVVDALVGVTLTNAQIKQAVEALLQLRASP